MLMTAYRVFIPGQVWEQIEASTPIYVPRMDDEGYELRVECSPGAFQSCEAQNEGIDRSKKRRIGEAIFVDSKKVMQGPLISSGAGRHELTETITPHGVIRVVSYNILSDQYASTEKALTELYSYLDTRYKRVCFVLSARARHLQGLSGLKQE